MRREASLGGRAAGAAAPLGTVLGDPQAKRRQVEHLPGLDPDHARTRQVGAAPAAPVGSVPGHLVGLRHLRQVGAWGAGLLAGPATFGPPIGAARSPRGLRSPSEDGGLEELEESLPSRRSSSATSPANSDQAGLLGVGRAARR